MKSITSTRGLGDLRTASTHHIAAKPRRNGTSYLELYTLDMERQRLETDLSFLEKRRERLCQRITEIQTTLAELEIGTKQKVSPPSPAQGSNPVHDVPSVCHHKERRWKKIPMEY